MEAANLALEAGRQLQKKQTGFVHYCYQDENYLTIPVLENALFALSLFRSRLSDHVLEGKALIEKLLPFEVEGNFPVYLHEYPQLHDPFLGLRLLPILFWIKVDFSHVIGELKHALDSLMDRMIAHAKTLDVPDWGRFRLDAFEGKVGNLPQSLYHWGEGLVSLQLAEKQGASIEEAICQACTLWHPKLSLYIGPGLRRDQEGHVAKLTLFDLFMCQWQKSFSERALRVRGIHLHGALIRPLSFEPRFIEHPVPWVHFNAMEECPLLIAWDVHTLVLSGKHLHVEREGDELIMDLDEIQEDLGVNFFCDHHVDHEILINGQKATTFQQKDTLEIRSKEVSIKLSFSAEDGRYLGHLMRGNRPSQHLCIGDDQFAAFDWRIAIRAVSKGKSPMRVRFQVLEQKQENQGPLPSHASHCPHIE